MTTYMSCTPILTLLLTVLSLSCGSEPLNPKAVNPKVQTTSGLIEGIMLQEAYAFFSIPYALPPVEAKRFEAPEAFSAPNETVCATQYKPISCVQFVSNCTDESCYKNMTEDCLVLSVFVPYWVDLYTSPNNSLPVMIWIHGGAFITGSSTDPLYDPRALCYVTGNIVVTINYRLGPFGFLVYGDSIMGNQGLNDQQLAMKWVQDNIDKFGGDKTNVTLFGQSAGAQSVALHLVSSVSQPLFARAILESNPAVFTYLTAEESKKTTDLVIRAVNCSAVADELECLRSKSVYELSVIQPQIALLAFAQGDTMATDETYRPVIDSEYKDQILSLFRDGKWNKEKNVIVGTTSQELEYYQYFFPPMNETVFRAVIHLNYGPALSDKIADEYIANFPPPNPNDYRITLGKLQTHFTFICPSRSLARFASSTSDQSVYFYISEHKLELNALASLQVDDTESSAYHGSEIPFVLRSGPAIGIEFDQNDYLVANAFNSYWGSFAITGNPSSGLANSLGSFPQWPLYKEPTWNKLIINAPQPNVTDNYLDDICDFWDSLNIYVVKPTSDAPVITASSTASSAVTSTTLELHTTTDSSSCLRGNVGFALFCVISQFRFYLLL